MKIINEVKLDFDDVFIRPRRSKISSRAEVDLNREYIFLNSVLKFSGFPLIASNMDATGTFAMNKSLSKFSAMTALHKYYSLKDLYKFYTTIASHYSFYTLGITDNDFKKLDELLKNSLWQNRPRYYCIDVANGYQDSFVKKVKKLRDVVGYDCVVMAGNVCTEDMTQELLTHGEADIIKIGVGSGSVCTTRNKTGIGYPQLSAIAECADTAHGCNGHICADGGCREVSDIVKAFGAGADFVMLGGVLAGTDECSGEWQYHHVLVPKYSKQKKSLKFYGMSSKEANDKYNNGLKDYRAAEGCCIEVPYKGPVENIVKEIMGGLRSACSYVGTNKLKDLSKCCTFVRKTI